MKSCSCNTVLESAGGAVCGVEMRRGCGRPVGVACALPEVLPLLSGEPWGMIHPVERELTP